jgi:cytoskeleton protein RodZ
MAMVEGEDSVEMTVGERLRAAREAAKLSIEDVATSTRIPTRHLASLETSEFSKLPAPTYSIGFAKSYAGAVGLDRNEIAEQLRAEIGGTRLNPHQTEQFEPIDPARAMPRWLIFAAIAAIALVVVAANWIRRDQQSGPDQVAAEAPAPTAAAPPDAVAPPSAQGPVTITATEQAWIQIKDGGTVLKEGILQPGESFQVPPTATAPTLTTGKAEALRISVGTAVAPAVGPPATKVSAISLLGADLLRGPAKPVQAANAPVPTRPAVRRRASPSAPNSAEPATTTNTQ